MRSALIIPARYGSTRLPGKPLKPIAGQTMLERVVAIANHAATQCEQTEVYVTTDDERIAQHCQIINVACLMTSPDCPSGTDRVAEAAKQLETQPDFVLNMQGDAPLTPPDFLVEMIQAYASNPCDVITPVTQLSWDGLGTLRKSKQKTPFSGTCAVFEPHSGKALWFSKQIIPAIRKEDMLRAASPLSPVYRHIGMYGYSHDMLQRYSSLPEGIYEALEGLEQLRVLEHGYDMRCVAVDYKGRASMSGVDSPEDIIRAEALIAQHGELLG